MTTVDDLLTALQSTDFRVRRNAAAELNRLVDIRSLSALIQTLESDPDEWVLIDAAEALGRIGDQRAVPALLGALKSEAQTAGWRQARADLGLIRDAQAQRERRVFLWQQVTAEISDIRCAAAISLGQLGNPDSVPGLIEALHDQDDPNVRGAAARALEMIGTPEALDAIGKK